MYTVTPALPEDLAVIDDLADRFRLDREHLQVDQFVVIRGAGGTVRAFGRVKPYPGTGVYELGTVGVREEERGKGLGEEIIRHLMRVFPSDEIWITTDLHEYFARFGFTAVDAPDVPPVLRDKLDRVCGSLRQNVVAMRARRPVM